MQCSLLTVLCVSYSTSSDAAVSLFSYGGPHLFVDRRPGPPTYLVAVSRCGLVYVAFSNPLSLALGYDLRVSYVDTLS